MARQEHTGICHICGEYKKLTYEHIPPEAAFNSQRRKMSTVKELMENKKDNRAPWDIEGLKYKQFQQGTGFFTLCGECNSFTGAKYGVTYSDFIKAIGAEILKIPKEKRKQGLSFHVEQINLLAFFKQVISSFASYLQIAPDELQMIARTLPADTQAYVEQMQRYAEQEENEACREMIEDNIREIGHGIAGGAMRHRFFLVFQYEPSMRAKRNTVQAIIQRLNEEADTARRYLDLCELEVLEPQYSDNFVLKLLYEILNKKTSQRVRLPEGVFDMTTAVHGIYEE